MVRHHFNVSSFTHTYRLHFKLSSNHVRDEQIIQTVAHPSIFCTYILESSTLIKAITGAQRQGAWSIWSSVVFWHPTKRSRRGCNWCQYLTSLHIHVALELLLSSMNPGPYNVCRSCFGVVVYFLEVETTIVARAATSVPKSSEEPWNPSTRSATKTSRPRRCFLSSEALAVLFVWPDLTVYEFLTLHWMRAGHTD
ncbi:hypothetical protein BDN71DRAFT_366344 [Pleurotus eryngii]|uniref:Uncharacterized protein n=1 Tax=Pleurotus eryngii TaxID=5323 RepID=A0A9P5ZM15_PLEER|nr:hypothetical protein BDN71DRAFT_366344 [Pleurotus eryngii]